MKSIGKKACRIKVIRAKLTSFLYLLLLFFLSFFTYLYDRRTNLRDLLTIAYKILKPYMLSLRIMIRKF